MGRVEINTKALRRSATDCQQLAQLLEQSESTAIIIADAVGHDGLAETVMQFGSKWATVRGLALDRLEELSERLVAIADTFDELDTVLAEEARPRMLTDATIAGQVTTK